MGSYHLQSASRKWVRGWVGVEDGNLLRFAVGLGGHSRAPCKNTKCSVVCPFQKNNLKKKKLLVFCDYNKIPKAGYSIKGNVYLDLEAQRHGVPSTVPCEDLIVY